MSLTNSPFWFASGATAAGGGGTVVYPYSIDQSLRFNDNDSAYLSRTPASSGNRKTWTWSGWVKRGNLGSFMLLFDASPASANQARISFTAASAVQVDDYNGSFQLRLTTSALLRDTSSWYNIVVSVDTTQATSSDRASVYINGVKQTSLSNEIYPSLNYDTNFNSTVAHNIGRRVYNNDFFLDGYMAEVNFIDGTALDATSFGETINGIWVPKAYSGSYGTNGFYLSFADSSAIGDDLSGNTNDFTANNLAASDVVPDSPTDNHATWSPIHASTSGGPVFSEGNTRFQSSGASWSYSVATMAMPNNSGKYAWKFQYNAATSGSSYPIFFITSAKDSANFGTDVTPHKSNGNSLYISISGTGAADSTIVKNVAGTDTSIVQYAHGGLNGATFEILLDTDANTITIKDKDGTARVTDYDVSYMDDGSGFIPVVQAYSYNNAELVVDYTPSDSDYKLLKSSSLPEPAIGPQQASGQQSDDYFETMLYTGNGAVQHIGSGGAQHPIDVTTVANSIRFNDDDSAYLNRTPASASNRKTFTLSTWIKPNSAATNYPPIFNAGTSAPDTVIRLDNTGKLQVVLENGGGGDSLLTTNKTLKSSSKWYHILVAVDTTNATADDRIKIYIDGVEETSFASRTNPSLNLDTNINNTVVHKIGAQRYASYWDGYMAEMYFIDGTALDPTSFGQYGSNGYWIPKAVSGLTFGTNGFYLDFSDNSTATALGTDSSGNGNDFSATNVATTDQMGDSPTQNFNIFDPNNCYSSGSRLSEGNLKYAHDGANGHHTTTLAFNSSGNWYWEVDLTNSPSVWLGIVDANQSCTGSGSINGYFWYPGNGYKSQNPYGSPSSYAWSTTATTGDIIGLQIKNEVMTIYKNGVSLGSPWTIVPGSYRPFAMSPGATSGISIFNFGADDSFAGNAIGGAGAADANGYGSFYYTPPTDALAIVDDNIPVEGLESPDFVWIKERNGTANHYLFDTVRGATKNLHSNTTDAEATDVNSLTSFDYQGFTIGSDAEINTTSNTYVAWNWKAGGKANTFNVDGTGYASMAAAGLTDGDIALTGLSVNTTSGFSIGTYTGIGAAGPSTIAHGLGKQVQLVMVKGRNNSDYSFAVYTRAGDADGSTFLNTGGQVGGTPAATSGLFTQDAFGSGSGTFNDSFFSIGGPNNYTSQSYNYLFYAFADVDGFSKAGSYVGNGSTDGTFVYTGFRPAWILWKRSDSTAGWFLMDSVRDTENVTNTFLRPNATDAESTAANSTADFLSNGFKLRGTGGDVNTSGGTFIYLAFAEAPFKYANAR